MGVKNKVYVLLCAVVIAYGVHMFSGVNDAVVTDVYSLIEGEIENTQSHGQIYLHFDGVSTDNAPKLLINGKSRESITESEKVVDVFDKCVVELDTRGLDTPVMMHITGKGANVASDCVGRVVTGIGDIQNIGTFIVNEPR